MFTHCSRGSKSDWADVWRTSEEARVVDNEIARLSHQPGTKTNPSQHGSKDKPNNPASLLRQYQLVQSRAFRWYFRSPVYIRGKVIINVAAGLFLGFTFYKQRNSAQGLQNKMFASFASLILSARMYRPSTFNLLMETDRFGIALMNGLQPRFIEMRAIYEAREEPSKMFHWSVFIITIVTTEICTNVMSGTLFFLPWYFAVGFWQSMTDRAARGIYQWLIFVRLPSSQCNSADIDQIMFEAWVSSFGQLLAAMAPNTQVAALLIPMTFVFVALFCGVLQPFSQLPKFWHFVHYASPFTWLVEYVVLSHQRPDSNAQQRTFLKRHPRYECDLQSTRDQRLPTSCWEDLWPVCRTIPLVRCRGFVQSECLFELSILSLFDG